MSQMEPQALAPAPASAGAGALASKKRRRFSVLTSRDKTLLAVMVGVPLFIFVLLIWVMTAVSVILSFTDWDGVQAIRFVGIDNYTQLFTTYPFFWPAVAHNVMWLLFFVCIATPIGMLLAILLDRPLRGSSVYQSIFFTPVVLSLAVVGFIWTLQYNAPRWLHQQRSGWDGARQRQQHHRLARRLVHQHLGGPGRRQLAPHRLHHGPVPVRPEECRPVTP
jgi:multiple sugar transport system permease protein